MDIVTILQGIQSGQPEHVQAAQAQLEHKKQEDPAGFYSELCSVIPNVDQGSQLLAFTLMRSDIKSSQSAFSTLYTAESPHVSNILQSLIDVAQIGVQRITNNVYCGVISAICGELGTSVFDLWPNLLVLLNDGIVSENSELQKFSIKILDTIISDVADLPQQVTHTLIPKIQGLVGLNNEIGMLASSCLLTYVISQEEDNANLCHETTVAFLNNLHAILGTQEFGLAEEMIELFSTFVSAFNASFKTSIVAIYQAMLPIFSAYGQVPENITLGALNCLVELAEAHPRRIRREIPEYVSNILPNLVELIKIIPQTEEEWEAENQKECREVYSELRAPSAAERAIDRLSIALGGIAVLNPCLEVIPRLTSSENYLDRYGALILIALIVEGCAKRIDENIMSQFVGGLQAMSQDQYARVRWASANAMQRLIIDLPESDILAVHGQTLGTIFLNFCANDQSIRVKAKAVEGLTHFVSTAEVDLVESISEAAFQAALSLCQVDRPILRKNAVSLIDTLIDRIGLEFETYYDTVVPSVKNVLQQATTPSQQNPDPTEHYELIIELMNVAATICANVPEARFINDLGFFIDVFTAFKPFIDQSKQQPILEETLISTYTKFVSKFAGEPALQPLLNSVMEHLLSVAGQASTIQRFTEAEVESFDENQFNRYEILPDGNKFMAIPTGITGEKAEAYDSIAHIIDNAPVQCSQYLERLQQIACNDLNTSLAVSVITASASIVARLPNIVFKTTQNLEQTATNVNQVLSILSETMGKMDENDYDTVCGLEDALECLVRFISTNKLGNTPIGEGVLQQIPNMLNFLILLTECTNISVREVMTNMEEDMLDGHASIEDQEQTQYFEEQANQMIEMMGVSIAQFCQFCFKAFSDRYWNILINHPIFTVITNWCSDQNIDLAALGVQVYAEAFYYCPTSREALHGQFFGQQGLMNRILALTDADSTKTDAINGLIYAIGFVLSTTPSLPNEVFQSAVSILNKHLNRSDARVFARTNITDNVIASFIRIALGQVNVIGQERAVELMRTALARCPIDIDETEAYYLFKVVRDHRDFVLQCIDQNSLKELMQRQRRKCFKEKKLALLDQLIATL